MATQKLLDRLHEDHARLGKVLTAFKGHLEQSAGRGKWLDLLANLVDYIAEYPDAVHHPMEDRLFEYIVNKGLTPAERSMVEQNLAEHEQLAQATSRLAQDVDDILGGASMEGSTLLSDAKGYLDLQIEHMRREESQLFPLAQRLLGESDWQSIETSISVMHDPLFDQKLSRFDDLFAFVTA